MALSLSPNSLNRDFKSLATPISMSSGSVPSNGNVHTLYLSSNLSAQSRMTVILSQPKIVCNFCSISTVRVAVSSNTGTSTHLIVSQYFNSDGPDTTWQTSHNCSEVPLRKNTVAFV